MTLDVSLPWIWILFILYIPYSDLCSQILDDAISCRHQKLMMIPNVPLNTTILNLGSNNFPTLDSESFDGLYKLQSLILDNCNIKTISFDTFIMLQKLENLDLSFNSLKSLEGSMFSKNILLKYINLQNNKLQMIPDYLFNGLALKNLQIQNNLLDSLSYSTFSNSSIENLNLDDNNITFLEKETFNSLITNLKNFSLSNNKRPLDIEISFFSEFKLDLLKLSNNSLSSHDFLFFVEAHSLDVSLNYFVKRNFTLYDRLRSLEFLNASNLDIQFLSDDFLCDNLKNLQILDLSNNYLYLIPGKVFKNLKNLKTLIISSNHILSLPYDLSNYLINLEILKAESSGLTTLEYSTFEDFSKLYFIDLSDNKIQVFPSKMKKLFNDENIHIDVSGNPLHCNCENLWLKKWVEKKYDKFNTDIRSMLMDKFVCETPTKISLIKNPVNSFVCSSPKFNYAPSSMVFFIGDTATLKISAESDPAPILKLFTPYGETVKFSPSSNRTQLKSLANWRKQNIQPSLSGNYRFVATNIEGKVVHEVNVSVVPYLNDTTLEMSTMQSSTQPIFSESSVLTDTTMKTTIDFNNISVTASASLSTEDNFTMSSVSSNFNFSSTLSRSDHNLSTILNSTPTASTTSDEDIKTQPTPDYTKKVNKKTIIIPIVIFLLSVLFGILITALLLFLVKKYKKSKAYDVSAHHSTLDLKETRTNYYDIIRNPGESSTLTIN